MRMSSFIVNLMESGGFIMECGQYINVDNIYRRYMALSYDSVCERDSRVYAVCVEERGGEVGVRHWEYDVQNGWDCMVETAVGIVWLRPPVVCRIQREARRIRFERIAGRAGRIRFERIARAPQEGSHKEASDLLDECGQGVGNQREPQELCEGVFPGV